MPSYWATRDGGLCTSHQIKTQRTKVATVKVNSPKKTASEEEREDKTQ